MILESDLVFRMLDGCGNLWLLSLWVMVFAGELILDLFKALGVNGGCSFWELAC